MMKKLFAAFLCAMLLTCTFALAEGQTSAPDQQIIPLEESAQAFDIVLLLPDGAAMTINEQNDDYTNFGVVKDHYEVIGTMAPSEEYAGLSLNDLTDDQVNALAEQAASDFDDAVIQIDITPSGNKYIMVSEREECLVATVFTVYRGYFVQLVQYHDDFSALTDGETAFMLEVLHGIEFTDVTK